LLKLKKLQILGFKSFCDRTELKFHGEGVAAIIGPNGCGKSNIADAISWVLGEQSAKTLRGARMEDVIFAGTRDRQPTGMAEVALTLIDPEVYDGPDAGEPTEIEIRDEIPADSEDWDEAAIRAEAAEEVERLTEEAQPGKKKFAAGGSLSAVDPDDEPIFAVFVNPNPPLRTPPPAAGAGPQVVLKVRRRKFQQQSRAGEIVVTRRLFRSGDSEYLLNGKLCRLRDIQELFMGTGLGPESYALIEQGRIGQILSSRPTDRRAIIEEAAGITKFKTKKRLAEARLEDAKQNLARVNDIFEEVTRQMNSLKRQASKAERYARLREEMRAQLRMVLVSKFAQLDQESAALKEQMIALSDEIKRHTENVQQLEAEHSQCTQRGYAIENESRENQERLSEIKLASDRADAARRHNEERCAEMAARSASLAAELAQGQERQAAAQTERDSNRRTLESAAEDLAGAQQELADAQRHGAEVAAALAEFEREQEESRSAILEVVASSSHLRNQLTQSEERLAAMDREAQRVRTEMDSCNSQITVLAGQRGQLRLEFETVSQRVAALSQEIAETRSELEVKRQAENEEKTRLDGLRAEYASALGKQSSLEAVIAEHGYSTESVRRLFQSGSLQGGLAPAGVLADFLEVEPCYESVVEDFLRDELNYVVVKSWDAADEGLRLLRTDVDGRATFLVHPEDAQAKFSFSVADGASSGEAGHSLVPLKSAIRVLNGFGRSLEVILPKLRDGYIVPDAVFARALALENPDAFFLSQTGECFHNVTVTGGKQRSEGPLSMKRELRDVIRMRGGLEADLREGELRVVALARKIKELTSRLEGLASEMREAEQQSLTSEHVLRQLDSDSARVGEFLIVHQRELESLSAEQKEQRSQIAAYQVHLAGLQHRREEIEQLACSGKEKLAILREQRDVAEQASSRQLARFATLEERHRSAAGVMQRIETLVAELADRTNLLASQIEAMTEEKSRREAENQGIAEQLLELKSERDATEARDGLLRLESEQSRARRGEIEEAVHTARQLLERGRDQRSELSAAAAKLESDAQHMADTCLNELNIPRHELLADSSVSRVPGDQLPAEEQSYRDLRTKLDGMGPVNMMALEEYKETAERHSFLETQRKDLLESIENTQATIREIDTFSRQKFEEAFHKINDNFRGTFSKLFGGGQAFMRLTDEENSSESGIDVVASPPGKKLQNVLLLSGGEKALTALALLVGIFQYQPSPFCILDEVDAPLDEANIGRFTELVREMSVQTQFVLITHSKKTMSIAPILYGVTMQEPGVSKLVSVRFGATA